MNSYLQDMSSIAWNFKTSLNMTIIAKVLIFVLLTLEVNCQIGCKTQPTTDGTSLPENCVFPFKFGNKTYYSCTKV